MSARVCITPEGNIRFVWDDELAGMLELGQPQILRASHVEPVNYPYLGGRPSVSGCGWEVNLSPVNGPRLGPFALRADALAAETQWLESAGY